MVEKKMRVCIVWLYSGSLFGSFGPFMDQTAAECAEDEGEGLDCCLHNMVVLSGPFGPFP